jgi:hypothetical protein
MNQRSPESDRKQIATPEINSKKDKLYQTVRTIESAGEWFKNITTQYLKTRISLRPFFSLDPEDKVKYDQIDEQLERINHYLITQQAMLLSDVADLGLEESNKVFALSMIKTFFHTVMNRFIAVHSSCSGKDKSKYLDMINGIEFFDLSEFQLLLGALGFEKEYQVDEIFNSLKKQLAKLFGVEINSDIEGLISKVKNHINIKTQSEILKSVLMFTSILLELESNQMKYAQDSQADNSFTRDDSRLTLIISNAIKPNPTIGNVPTSGLANQKSGLNSISEKIKDIELIFKDFGISLEIKAEQKDKTYTTEICLNFRD